MKILKKAKWKLSHDMEVILADQEKGVLGSRSAIQRKILRTLL
jgi:hypothetical protein